MSPRTGSIRKYQNSQSLMGVLPSLDSKQNLTLTSGGEVQPSTLPDKRNPPVYVLIRVSSLASLQLDQVQESACPQKISIQYHRRTIDGKGEECSFCWH
ncbi:hypothetical protein AVEN_274431-1 [Araneus ventricosus]|uniref:Uncharacterized protein n=1 Tax=Araneus ventricosus TaxID=182803 RepID=A0A4Y2F8P9_ARAVE|nr:hypothetical protein AVEN_274431-1 [Araneus ventricosus]